MTRDDIIRTAREAGVYSGYESELFQRFAALVAAVEREACAEICEELAARNKRTEAHLGWVLGNEECAAAIRARGENK